jgi:signal transduction histidine kinase
MRRETPPILQARQQPPALNRDPLRVLNLEADEGDHELVRRSALSTGLSLEFSRAANRAEFEAALARGGIDLILADHCIPGYDGVAALESARALRPGVPYVIVSNSTGEDRAAECIRRGARDFVHKDRLGRLPAAILQATQRPGRPGAPDRLLEPERELVGQLAGAVAHDFNNLLTIISGYVSMLLDRDSVPPDAVEILKRVFTASRRATWLVSQLLVFSGKSSPKKELIDLNEEVGLIAGMLSRELSEAVAVEFSRSPDAPCVDADIGMLGQLLMNLAINARDAMARGGRLTLAVSLRANGDLAPGRRAAHGGSHACLTVRDNGRGIPAPDLPRIFEPFATTRPEGRGAGLGLATAQEIARLHGGWIEVESEMGVGTEFRTFLPLARTSSPGAPGGAVRRQAKATLLLVEDEAAVRDFAAAVLKEDGYVLLQAESGGNALEAWRWHSARIDLLVTDVVLPGEWSGQRLAARMRAEKPALKVILTTGLGNEDLEPRAAGAAPEIVLSKPYTPSSLLRAVREALG